MSLIGIFVGAGNTFNFVKLFKFLIGFIYGFHIQTYITFAYRDWFGVVLSIWLISL